jgi:glucose/arabinose dehydrogenase
MRSARLIVLASLAFFHAAVAAPVDTANFSESTYVSSTEIGLITGIGWAPDGSGRLFVIRKGGFNGQQNAQVRIVQNGAVLPEVFATESVYTNSECGLIGMAFDPDFVNNRYVYFFVTASSSEQRIIRYSDVPDAAQRLASRTVIVSGLPTIGQNHDGGGIGIGNDGRLYWAIGDLGNGTGVNADLTSMAAKIGRANRFTGAALNDNPFFDGAGPNADHIWSRGYRNPFTMTFQVSTGQLWVNSVGTHWEQVFVPQRGDHAGYIAYENNQPAGFLTPTIAYRTNGTDSRAIAANGVARSNGIVTFTTTTPHPFRKGAMATIAGVSNASFNGAFAVVAVPSATQFTVAQSGPNETSGGGNATTQNIGGAITGGCFYESTAFPAAYRGNFFFGDYNSSRIMRVPLDAANLPIRTEEFVNNIGSHVDMTTGPDGALYYANQSSPGTIRRLAYTGTEQNVIVFPTALNVVEGGSSVISVRLRSAPPTDVVVTAERMSGATQLAVASGARLIFTPTNWAVPQLVRISAAEDLPVENESARFRISATGIAYHDIAVNTIDNDEPQLVLSTTNLKVREGASASFTVRLATAPPGAVNVAVRRTPVDSRIAVTSGDTLTFTPENFSTPQTVTVAAPADADYSSQTATVTVSMDGEIPRQVKVDTIDEDRVAPTFTGLAAYTAVQGSLYASTVQAAGNPAPGYTLLTAPAGMSINSATGQLNWTPAAVGSYDVVVRASNGVPPDADEAFTITVKADAPPFARLTRPVAGEVLSGANAEFFGDGFDDVGAVKAEFYVDGVLRYTDNASDGHFHFGGAHTQFDTTQFTNGPHTLRMRVTDTKGQTGETEVQVTFGNGGDQWRQQHFNLNDPNDAAASAFAADPNADGESNLLEYFTDSNPKVADVSRAPRSEVAQVGADRYLTLRVVRAKWVNDVSAVVETAGGLIGMWEAPISLSDPNYILAREDNVPAFGLETVVVRDRVPATGDSRFMRLRLTTP